VGSGYRREGAVSFSFLRINSMSAKTPEISFGITLQSKSQRAVSQLRDGLRIVAWQDFRSTHKELVGEGKQFPSNFELYAVFSESWMNHEVQKMDFAGIKQFIASLEYSEVEINQIRKEYYEARKGYSVKADIKANETDEIPY
jgi:hypothetical protein